MAKKHDHHDSDHDERRDQLQESEQCVHDFLLMVN
jgi:hypothetical protein